VRPSWVEIDLDAIRDNTAAIARAVAPARACAVVKADGYGHGDVPAAHAAIAGGARWLAVALLEEGRRLRDAGIDVPILLLSECTPDDAAEVVALQLVPTVYRAALVEALAGASAASAAAPLPVHLKVNTGMHRVGADPVDAVPLARRIAQDEHLDLQGLWTHFAVSEEDTEFTTSQTAALGAFRMSLAAEGIDVPVLHAANTAAALEYPGARFDLVRVGLGIYGMRPAPHVGRDIYLRPAMRVVSRVSMVRRLRAGERPSYGRRRPMPAEGIVATVPIGYADGVARLLPDRSGVVLIRGNRYPYAGAVTMDQVMIDVGEDPIDVGDEVVLLGSQGEDTITAEEWGDWLNTINYEIVCRFGPRLPRRYRGLS